MKNNCSANKMSQTNFSQKKRNFEINLHLSIISNFQILQLITHMHDKCKILLMLYFITNQAPEGADQVEAAYECLKFALKYEKELVANKKNAAADTVIKIKRKYPLYKTRHLLHLYALDEDKFFELVEHPVELINALYSHQIILNPRKPDVNKVSNSF